LQSSPRIPVALRAGRRALTAAHSPRQNHLLAALPAKDFARLLPHLEPVSLPLGWTVYGGGERERHLYFLTDGIVYRFNMLENGASAEFAVTGNEGVIGIASFLGGESTPGEAVVTSAGYAYRLRAGFLKSEFEQNGPLQHLLLRHTMALMAQIGQIAACNRHHILEQRLCHLILSCWDRLHTSDLTITQELIAAMLGVRREGVTQAAGDLQKAGLIHYYRGHIAVLDRPGLVEQACECYAVVKKGYDRLRQEIPALSGVAGSLLSAM
jgi:CRP-like cAMP-binding protein